MHSTETAPPAPISTLIVLIAVGVGAFCMTTIMPGLVAGLVVERGVTEQAAALVVVAGMLGMTIAVFTIAPFMSRIDRRRFVVMGLLVAICADLVAALIPHYVPLLVCRFVGGLGEGLTIAIMLAAASSVPNPGRIFALFMSSNLIAASVLFAVIPSLLRFGGISCLMVTVAVLVALALACTPWFPHHANVAASAPGPRIARARSPTFLLGVGGLVGIFLFYGAIGAVWPLMARAGAERGLAAQSVGNVLAEATAFAVLAGLLSAWLSNRVPRVVAIVVGLVVLAGTDLLLYLLQGPGAFALLAISFICAWTFTTPFSMALLAELDAEGSLVALSLAMQFAGFVVGPAIAALVIPAGGLMAVDLASAALATAATLTLLIVEMRVPRYRNSPVLQSLGLKNPDPVR